MLVPIFLKLSKSEKVVGFDINQNRINKLKKYVDVYKEFKKRFKIF